MNKKVIGVIPARYESSRFPGKPLAMIAGKPMVQRVYEQAKQVSELERLIVATDDERIADAVKAFGGEIALTGHFSCGTERVAAAAKEIHCDVVVNIQGDEPMIPPDLIRQVIRQFEDTAVNMATLKKELRSQADIANPNIAKVVTDRHGDAILFSRNAIPYCRNQAANVRYYKHIGIYGYTKAFLLQFAALPRTGLEIAEELEQLRALEYGYKIRVAKTELESIGVDLPEHVQVIEEFIRRNEGFYE